ncbi:Type II restriction enzyme, methylase subunit [Halapricum desulfuricans]|uniref:site-specific DNA-methyltransferase (adenine-specific) n=1 Tax=Halapricum desulfuricans TaxID=2841257 RepID=A0A897NX64_9EURY|nr:N-6 DNA methylase [Halapricum desulfuricans]QSG15199.1 Type II restriction enzyme, methylase subunit [Halapricum desulfuricans]
MSQATLGEMPYRNSGLFADYYLRERIDDLEEWDCDDTAEDAFDALRALYLDEHELLAAYKEHELIDAWVDPVIEALGFEKISETSLPDGGGEVDGLLYDSAEDRREAMKRKRDDDTRATFARANAILEVKQWDADFDAEFSERRNYRDASNQIKYYLERTPDDLAWGVLTNGRKWRLYSTKDYETQIYYEVDLPEILRSGDLEEFKYFYTFFGQLAFRETAGATFLETVWSESETAAEELGEDLQDNVFTALRVLGRGFVEYNDLDIDPEDDAALAELKEQSLVLLYRLMFVLYAESRGLIHPDEPGAQEEYEDNFSLDAIRREIYEEIEAGKTFEEAFSEYATGYWGRLQDLFELIDNGEESLGIPPYNGGLFDREEHDFLADHEVSDRHLAEVIYQLSTVANDEDRDVLADYADLDTRHLGSVYEGLLEHDFRIAPEQYAAVAEDGAQVWKPATEVSVADAVETVPEGGLYVVNDEGERKATGAYYTPDYVVTYIVEETVGPLVDDIEDDLQDRGLERSDVEYFRGLYDGIQELRILDPAMGSGHFLTKATAYLTERVMEVVREQEQFDFPEDEIRRTIAKECIYGVDLNGMAVELAKLSMWLETLAADKPLAFFDHHLKTGNSLVGSDITEVLSEDSEGEGGQLTLTQAFARVRQRTLGHVMELMQELLAIDNDELADIKSMEELYDEIRDDPLYGRLFELANVHTAERFGLDVPEGAYEEMADAIEDEDDWAEIQENDWFTSAQAMAGEETFFHWELEFPEVFFDQDGEKMDSAGFDAVVGNPPYVRIQSIRANTPIQANYISNKYQSSVRNFDLYMCFTEEGYRLTNPTGKLGFIEPHKFFKNKSGEGLREFISDRNALDKVVSFGHEQVFNGASVYTCVLVLSASPQEEFEYAELSPINLITVEKTEFRYISEYDSSSWIFNSIGVKEVLDRIDQQPRKLEDIAKVYVGLQTSADSIYLLHHVGEEGEYELVESKEDGETHKIETEILKPFLKGEDVGRYEYVETDRRVIFPYDIPDNSTGEKEARFIEEKELSEKYPKAYDYLTKHEEALRGREDGKMDNERWYDYVYPKNLTKFEQNKILTPEIGYGGSFTLDENDHYHKTKVYGVLLNDDT